MTIYDIAREAGVSASSVSRVINNKPGVSRANRAKISALLEKYHFVSNETARGLVTGSSKLVGILVADIRTQHHIEGAYHIARVLAAHGYCSLILNTGDSDQERVDSIRTLEQRKVEAAVLMGSIFQTPQVKNSIERSLPHVPVFMLNGFLDLPNVYGVLSDERNGVEECVHLLIKKQRYKIAFMVDKPTPSSQLKTEGFQKGMQALPVHEKKPLWIYSGVEGSLNGGREAMQQILRQHPDVNGVICSLDILACGALRTLQEAGRRVPQDVAVIGIDNSVYAEICNPRLTSLDNMLFDSSVTIAHKLVDCLEGRRTNQKTMLFTDIVEREST